MANVIPQKIRHLIADICMQMGLNTAHDFDGVEDDEDVEIYLKAIKRQLPPKRIADNYIVDTK